MTYPALRDGESVAFQANDGHHLHGTFFRSPEVNGGLPVLICPATGVRQIFYYPFARWLNAQGHPVLVFDYRGVGASLPHAAPKICTASKQDWGEQDMPGALDWLLSQTGQARAALVGHSAGAQLVGLMPNHRRISRLVAVSASSGHVGNVRFPMRLAAWFFVWLYIPLTTRLLGYLPARWIGWGEDLPPGIARQWARWCRSPGYVENDFGRRIRESWYHELTCPITLLYAEDDPLATRPNVDDWLRLMPAAPRQVTALKPADWGCKGIGHIDLFRSSHAALWPLLLNAIEKEQEKQTTG